MDTNHYNTWHGLLATTGGIVVSYMDALTPFMRFASLMIGCMIGLATLILKVKQLLKK